VRLTVDRRGRAAAIVSPLAAETGEPVTVTIDPDPVDTASPFLFHKTTRRSVYDDRKNRHPDVGDVLLVNAAGQITETTVANVAVKLDGAWVTPSRAAGCLPGVYRQVLLDGGRLEERDVLADDLERCQGIALLNSVRLWRSAVLVDD
jgi:para-aminobenzoate synthetase/4-amino-4-deoxychorismate lyase